MNFVSWFLGVLLAFLISTTNHKLIITKIGYLLYSASDLLICLIATKTS